MAETSHFAENFWLTKPDTATRAELQLSRPTLERMDVDAVQVDREASILGGPVR